MCLVFNFFFKKDPITTQWKEKAKSRREEIKQLKKQNKELSTSRDRWKHKAEALKQSNAVIEAELKKNT